MAIQPPAGPNPAGIQQGLAPLNAPPPPPIATAAANVPGAPVGGPPQAGPGIGGAINFQG